LDPKELTVSDRRKDTELGKLIDAAANISRRRVLQGVGGSIAASTLLPATSTTAQPRGPRLPRQADVTGRLAR
jgi:hypothetical protein